MGTTTENAEPETENLPAIVRQTAEAAGRNPIDSRAESIAKSLDAAYQNASKLELRGNEAELLAANFPDEAFTLGAGGNKSLLYIEHAYLRQRLNDVLGVGAATTVRRREWTEPYEYWKTIDNHKDGGEWRKAANVYVDLVLVVRGCFVSEAIGEAVYYFSNDDGCYSDALESAESNAFRRCCKKFGVGLQAWMKGWSDEWKRRNPSGRPRAQSNGAKQEPPKRETTIFEPPNDWPDTEIHDLKLWIDSFSTSAHFKTALGMFLNEPALSDVIQDWEPIIRHFAESYKKKAKVVATTELNNVIKAALDKMELDKSADELLNREAAEAAS